MCGQYRGSCSIVGGGGVQWHNEGGGVILGKLGDWVGYASF